MIRFIYSKIFEFILNFSLFSFPVESKLGECSSRDPRQSFQAHLCLQRQSTGTCSFTRFVINITGCKLLHETSIWSRFSRNYCKSVCYLEDFRKIVDILL